VIGELVSPHCLLPENNYASIDMQKILVHGKHETEWVTISKDEYDSMNRTIDVLSEKELMAQLKKSKAMNVKSRDFEDVAKELGI
jgi:PHD/YefM family antitoxin component YafN of YafNO toxin-antitoxin module